MMRLETLAVWIWLAGALLPACFAQNREVGGSVGYGFYRSATVFGPGASVQAGILDRFAVSFVGCEDLYEYVSGEVRYLYQDGDPFLSAGGDRVVTEGNSHAFDYALLFHLRNRESRFRPFIAVGAGAKWYLTSGPGPPRSGLAGIASLTTRDQWKFLTTVGAGVKYRVHPNILLRAEVKDYITGFPSAIIAPAPGNTARGLFQQITPMAGVSYSF